MSDTADIVFALRTLGAFASGIIPSRVCGPGFEPTRQDAKDIIGDLLLLADRVDRVILAYGEYCRLNGIVTAREVKEDFTKPLLGALEGNALFDIENGVEQRIEDRQYA